MARPLLLCLGLLAGAVALPEAPDRSLKEMLDWEPRLGNFAFDVTTKSTLANRLFKIGIQLIYNFDQPNARAAFQHALLADADCAMCAWGLAHAYGPYLNQPTRDPDLLQLGSAAASKAFASLLSSHSAKERAFIESMASRYPSDGNASAQLETYRRYAERLRQFREADAQLLADPDLMVFDAEAIMLLMCDSSGYNFYIPRGDELPPVERPETKEVSSLLRAALVATNQTHTYAQHLLIHNTELSNADSETAVDVAVQLLKITAKTQNQHLQHMTSHTFQRAGHYHEAVVGNVVAVKTDAEYLHHGVEPNGPIHDLVFLISAALWGGERAAASKFAQNMQQILEEAPGTPDYPDGSMAWSYPMLVAIRFGDWDGVQQLDVKPPGNFSVQWPYGYGVLRHFSLAVAGIHRGRLADAHSHVEDLRSLMPAVANTGSAELMNLTAIANHTVSAIAANARGDLPLAIDALKRAVDIEMDMPYRAPPNWLLPSRECYGRALLSAGRPSDAEHTFRAALYGYSFHAEPHCGWALLGLRQSLQQQPSTAARAAEIEALTQKIASVWKHADVPLASPCLHLGDGQPPVFT